MALPNSAAQSVTIGIPEVTLTEDTESIPIVEVAYGNDMWWSMPRELSAGLYAQYMAADPTGAIPTYVWEERTYTIDFEAMVQTNNANGRKRSIRFVHVLLAETTPLCTGQLPQT